MFCYSALRFVTLFFELFLCFSNTINLIICFLHPFVSLYLWFFAQKFNISHQSLLHLLHISAERFIFVTVFTLISRHDSINSFSRYLNFLLEHVYHPPKMLGSMFLFLPNQKLHLEEDR